MLKPTVFRYMTSNPYTVAADDPMSKAHRLMRTHGFRHVPVVDGSKLLGIVSDRDLHLFDSLRYERPEEVSVREVMRPGIATVAPDAPLDDVIERMAIERCDAVAVVHKTEVVGIFTATDALWALANLLRREAA